jgi:hypothetical protein
MHHVRDDGESELRQQEEDDAEDDRHPEKETEFGRNERHRLLTDQADEDGEQAGTFHEGADDDGGQAVVVGPFRLAGTGLEGGLTDVSDTESGGDSGDSGAQRGTGFPRAAPAAAWRIMVESNIMLWI